MDTNAVEAFWLDVDIKDSESCWNWKGINNGKGYGRTRLDGYILYSAHRISYEIKNGPIQEGLMCLHKCDNRSCVNPDHLYLGTAQDNHDDMKERNSEAIGRNPLFCLDELELIRNRYKIWINTRMKSSLAVWGLSVEFKCSETTIRNILKQSEYTYKED